MKGPAKAKDKMIRTYWEVSKHIEYASQNTSLSKIMMNIRFAIEDSYRELNENYKMEVMYILAGVRGGKINKKERAYDALYRSLVGKDLDKEDICGKYVSWHARLEALKKYLDIVKEVDQKSFLKVKEYTKEVLSTYMSLNGKNINKDAKRHIENFIKEITNTHKRSFMERLKEKAVTYLMIAFFIGGYFPNSSILPNMPHSSTLQTTNSQYTTVTNVSSTLQSANTTQEPKKILDVLNEYARSKNANLIVKKNKDGTLTFWLDKVPERKGLLKGKENNTYSLRKDLEELGNDLVKYLKKEGYYAKDNVKITKKYAGYTIEIDTNKDGKKDIRGWLVSIKKGVKNIPKRKSVKPAGSVDLLDGKADGKLFGYKLYDNGTRIDESAVTCNYEEKDCNIKQDLKENALKKGIYIEIVGNITKKQNKYHIELVAEDPLVPEVYFLEAQKQIPQK